MGERSGWSPLGTVQDRALSAGHHVDAIADQEQGAKSEVLRPDAIDLLLDSLRCARNLAVAEHNAQPLPPGSVDRPPVAMDDHRVLTKIDHQLGAACVIFVLHQFAQHIRRGMAERELVEQACRHAELQVQARRIGWYRELIRHIRSNAGAAVTKAIMPD